MNGGVILSAEYVSKLFEGLEKDTERYNRIMRKMNQGGTLKGCRRGRAPIPMLRNIIKNQLGPRLTFYEYVLGEYFPDEHITDENSELLNELPDRIPGRMASFALHGKEDEFPMGLIQQTENAEDTADGPVAAEPATDTDEGQNEGAAEEQPSPDEEVAAEEQPPAIPEQKPTLTHENTDRQASKRKEKKMKTKYFGNIQVSSNFYNFYPYAIVNDDGTLSVMNLGERKNSFPLKGNINIYTADRNSPMPTLLYGS